MPNKRIHLFTLLLTISGLWSTSASADRITLRTTKTIGETITITLNANVQSTIKWGDESTQEVFFDGTPVDLCLVTDTLTLMTTAPITTLDVADCGLQTLNLTRATAIEALSCADNELQTLSVTSLRKLRSLDCSGNRLTSLALYNCSELKSLNCAGNRLESLSLSGNARLQTLICNENKLQKIDLNKQTGLRFLWIQDNELTQLDISRNPELRTLLASDNELNRLTVDKAENMQELWIDRNDFDSLNIKPMTNIVRLSADRNRLRQITYYHYYKRNLKYCYLQENALAYNSFPAVYDKSAGEVKIHNALVPQAPIELPDHIFMGENLDISALVKNCAGNTSINPVFVWKKSGTDETLTENTDYKRTGKGKYTFLTAPGFVYAVITAPEFPGFELTTGIVNVADPTGIRPTATDNDLQLNASAGTLTVRTTRTMQLTICTVGGSVIAGGTYPGGTHQWSLQPGIYVVNGKKITMPSHNL